MRLYYLSFGSNIAPEHNSIRTLELLCRHFGEIISYPLVYTRPQGINSDSIFINTLCLLQSDLGKAELKALFNTIEIDLGRNRNDPESALKDRPADLDILGDSAVLTTEIFRAQRSSFIQEVLDYKNSHIADLSRFDLPAFQRPSTIHLDAAAGNVWVINDAADRLVEGAKPAFLFQRRIG
jgi:2-amino-4-hydroxy-6-hydroxymethyldihydropteridine diphosphokinase